MKKINLTLAAIVTAGMLVLTGCTKAGPTGPAGANGTPGTNGTNGNGAIVNLSITINPSDWTYSSTYSQWYYNYSNTSNFNSAVLGYVMSGNGEQPLPYVDTPDNYRCTMATYLFGTPPYIQFQYTNFTTPTTAPTSAQYFYLVIIPPAMVKPNVNVHSYAEVKAAYHLD